MSESSERRVHSRTKLNMLVQIHLTDMDEFMREYASNISAGGMFVRTEDPRPKDSMIYFQFRLTDGSRPVEGLGKVVHVNSREHDHPGMGIEFVNLDDTSKGVIDEIISSRVGEITQE